MGNSRFDFKHFSIKQDQCAMKVGTDAVLLGAWAEAPTGVGTILDAGTGTGIIALMMAQRYPQSRVTAIDIDTPATKQARGNVQASPFADRISVQMTSLQEHCLCGATYDAIVCNPPYFYDSLVSSDIQRTTARHAITLTARDIANAAVTLLNEGGELSVIMPFDQRERMEAEASFAGLFVRRRCNVRTSAHKQPIRVMLAFTNRPCTDIEQKTMTVGDQFYQQLTDDFYIEKERQ